GRRDVAGDEIGSGRGLVAADRALPPLAPADALQAHQAHQASDPFAANGDAEGRELGVSPGLAIRTTRSLVRRGSDRSASHPLSRATTPAARATRRTRCRRPPAPGPASSSDA